METINTLLDYIRIVSYALVILLCLRNIMRRRFSKILFVGDIIMAFTLMIMSLQTNLGVPLKDTRDLILTPAVVIWALIHFFAMIKEDIL